MLVPNIVQFTLPVRKEHWVNSLHEPLKLTEPKSLKPHSSNMYTPQNWHLASGSQADENIREPKNLNKEDILKVCICQLFLCFPVIFGGELHDLELDIRGCRCMPGTLRCIRQRLKLCGTGYKGEQAKRAQPVFVLKIIRCLVYKKIAGRICPKLIWQEWLSSGGGFIKRDSHSLGCFFFFFSFQNLENGYVLHLWTELKY